MICETSLASIVALLSLISQCVGWSSNAHLVIAQLARDELFAQGQQALVHVLNELLNDTSVFFPGSSSLVTTATWADDLMWRDGNGMFASWHFVNFPFVQNGSSLPTPPPPESSIVPQDNVWGTLKYCNASLALLDADTTPSTRGKMFLASFCLRWLVHVVGDVHQPLHTTQRYSDQFPNGDQGGNLCKINRTEGNLHALWDQGGGMYSHLDFDHPPTSAQFALIHKQAADLRAAWPRSHFPNSTVDYNNFRQWINESYALAVAIAYQNGSLVCNASLPLTAEYLQAVVDTSGSQMALAAYRLAELVIEFAPRTYVEQLPIYCANITEPGVDIIRFEFSRTYLYIGIAGTSLVLIALLVGAFCIGKRRAMQQRHGPFGFERLP
jgi:hypothetical protein